MTGRRPSLWAAAVLAGAIAATAEAPAAHGYVRSKTKDGVPAYWATSCTSVTVFLNGFSPTRMTRDEVAKSLAAAAHAWSPDSVACTGSDGGAVHPYFEIVLSMAPDGAGPPTVAPEGVNVLVFHLDDWPDNFSDQALAVTSVTKKGDGRIIDADVEINAQWLEWANLDPGAAAPGGGHGLAGPYDLQDALTHEFGHFIGFDHTCFGPADSIHQVDNNGDAVPFCGPDAPPSARQSVMYAVVDTGEVSHRLLSADDMAGVCDVYPPARDPKTCALDLPDDGCGCGAAPVDGRAARGAAARVPLLLLAVFALAARRRRARRS